MGRVIAPIMTTSARSAAQKVASGEWKPEDITEESLPRLLYMGDLPDPDLLIRTSGEMRLSNFLLWESAYTELYVTKTLWPDFRKEHLFGAIAEYQSRERRFGGI